VARFPAPAGAGAVATARPVARDATAPRVRVRWPRSHRVDRRRLTVAVRCSEACELSARAELRAAGRRVRLAAHVRGRARAVVALTARARAQARRALRRGHTARVWLTLVARDPAGNRGRVVRSFGLR
jgi:hypothetical protein